ncbi:MAG: UDP-N-acetylmuramoyl-tripeptide--D-alanyl-D-alanine ligase [Anaerolineae bacterium]
MRDELTLAAFIEGLGSTLGLSAAPRARGWYAQSLEAPVDPIIDSREAEPGSIFFAFEGERVDGHDFVADAFERGAVAAVVERGVTLAQRVDTLDMTGPQLPTEPVTPPLLIRVPDVLTALQGAARWWRRQRDVRVLGITGSVGKTTTKEMVAQVLSKRYHVTHSQESYNNEIGLPLTLLRLTAECERVVLEMGMYVRGDICFLTSIAQPDVGIVTNVAPVHAERAGTIDEIALGKRELVEALPAAPDGVAVLNYDDERVRAMAAHTQARPFFYGVSAEASAGADLWADEIESLGLEGVRAVMHHLGEAHEVRTPLLGRHSIYPMLRAAAAGLVEGLGWAEIREALATPGESLRLVPVAGPEGSLILDDTYNSSPPSAHAALALLEELEGRKLAVLGDMLELGTYEREGHLEVGCRAAEIVSELIVVGELGKMIAEGAKRCGLAAERIREAPDSEAAVDVVRSLIREGDVILIKGSRGVQMEHIVEALRGGPS